MSSSITTCLNCGNQYEGNYCPVCGQSAATARFSIGSLVHRFLGAFNFEHGMLYLMRELTLRPGQLVADYLAGRRHAVYDPLKYLLWSTALLTLLNILFKPETLFMVNMEVDGVVRDLNLWTTGNMTLLYVVSLLFYALMTRAFFRSWRYNYAEHIVLNTFCLGHVNFINSLLILTLFWTRYVFYITSALPILVPAYFYVRISRSWKPPVILRAVLAAAFSLLLYFIPVLIIVMLDIYVFHGALGYAPM